MEPGEGVVLTVVSGEPEALVVCGLLESNGIDCAYRDTDDIERSLEEFTAAGPVEILVRREDLEVARELIVPVEDGAEPESDAP
jgi:putative signal transducing protein